MTTPNQTQTQNKAPKEKPYVVVDFLDLDPKCFTFLPPKANAHGGHFVPIRYNGKSLYVTYEARTCPFGVSTNKEEKSDYKGKYPEGKKITGFSTSISCHKDYQTDPYYQKAAELDEFFIDACQTNAMCWHLGGTASRPLGRDAVAGYDEQGADGKWKRFLKWSYKKTEDGERKYLDYPPRMEFNIPTTTMSEYQGADGLMVQEAVLKPVFFDQDANKLDAVSSSEIDSVLPKWSRLSVLAQWATITQGTFGATLKPKAQQFRIYPNEQLATDECLLNDDGEDEHDIGDALASGDFSGGAKVTKLRNTNSNPAPLDLDEAPAPAPAPTVASKPVRATRAVVAPPPAPAPTETEEDEEEVVADEDMVEEEEPIEVVGEETEPEPEPEPVKPVRTAVARPARRVVTAKKQ